MGQAADHRRGVYRRGCRVSERKVIRERPVPKSEEVSKRMRRQASTHTAAEIRMTEALVRCGYKVAHHPNDLPGRPDIVLERHKIAIFVNGCFWHGCPRHFRCPTHNRAWWSQKIEMNRARDRRKSRTLRRMGYSVAVIWEHDDPATLVRRVRRMITNGRPKKSRLRA